MKNNKETQCNALRLSTSQKQKSPKRRNLKVYHIKKRYTPMDGQEKAPVGMAVTIHYDS